MKIILESGITLEVSTDDYEISIYKCRDANGKELKPYFDYYWDGTAVIRFEEVEK